MQTSVGKGTATPMINSHIKETIFFHTPNILPQKTQVNIHNTIFQEKGLATGGKKKLEKHTIF